MGQVLQGVVKWFNDAKGFGFIEHESGQDVFVHYSVIDQDGFKTLKDGEPVEYELREGDKGLNASRVSRVGGAPSSPEKSEESDSTSTEGQPLAAATSLELEVESTTTNGASAGSTAAHNSEIQANQSETGREEG